MTPAVSLAPEVAVGVLVLGLLLSFICYLTTNLSPGGMITPGWFALTLVEDWRHAIVIVALTGATYGGARLMQRVTILYGKRLFAAVVLLGAMVQAAPLLFAHSRLPIVLDHQTLGFFVPGVLAYHLIKQRPMATLMVTGGVSLAGYAILITGVLAGLIPIS